MHEFQRLREVQEWGRRLERMFSAIVPYYDFLNRFLSLRRDVIWRRELVRGCPLSSDSMVLDLAAGTLDVAREIVRQVPGCLVVAVDFSLPMLQQGWKKLTPTERRRIRPVAADAYCLPFPDATFDALTIAFGVRNLPDRPAALAEMRRVLRPGGWLAILEFAPPTGGWRLRLYRLYLKLLLPLIGRWFSRHAFAYRYLADSISAFPPPVKLAAELEAAGFATVSYHLMTAGIVGRFYGRREDGISKS